MFRCGFDQRRTGLIGILSSGALILSVQQPLYAQTKGTKATRPVTPTVPSKIVSRPQPIRDVVNPSLKLAHVLPTSAIQKFLSWLRNDWSYSLLGTYQFLNERSRVGDISLDNQSVGMDFVMDLNRFPYTNLDFGYSYLHANGSSPDGRTETLNQHVGSLSVLQPLEPIFARNPTWQPAPLSTDQRNFQWAAILGASYGSTAASVGSPGSVSTHFNQRTFIGNALLDYQFAWFPNRKSPAGSKKCDDYAKFYLEISSGIQVLSSRLDSSDGASRTSYARQVTYQNIATADYAFWGRVGVLVSAEWDAPVSSKPFSNSQAYYANTATFTGGLTYNYYPGVRCNKDECAKCSWLSNHCSVSVLYSYTAFDPLTETNELSVRFSYTF
jgi:hypothetical protein